MRTLYPLAIVFALIGSVIPAHAGSRSALTVSEQIFAWQGHWQSVDWGQMVSGERLRIDVQVATLNTPASGISVAFALRHVTWPGSHPITLPADVGGRLHQTMQRGQVAHFETILQVPVTHPLQFSRVVIHISHGRTVRTTVSGVTFEPPSTPAETAIRLTVPQVFSFCAAQRSLSYLSYGVGVRAYARPVITGGDGPPQFVVLASRNTTGTNLTTLTQHHEGFRAGGFASPPRDRLVTIVGSLVCLPQVGFGISGVSR